MNLGMSDGVYVNKEAWNNIESERDRLKAELMACDKSHQQAEKEIYRLREDRDAWKEKAELWKSNCESAMAQAERWEEFAKAALEGR